MPNGGQLSAGSGLRLQATSPGVTDAGNFHISGTGIADTALSTCVNTNLGTELHGSVTFLAGPTTVKRAVYGKAHTVRHLQEATNFGLQCTTGSQHSVALGDNCSAGSFGAANSQCVALGYNAKASYDDAHIYPAVAIGSNVNAFDANAIAVGMSVTCDNTGLGQNNGSICFGRSITSNLTNVIFGYNITTTGKSNILAIGYFSPTKVIAQNDLILIGNPTQTTVIIGPYMIKYGTMAQQYTNNTSVTVNNTVAETSLVSGNRRGTWVIDPTDLTNNGFAYKINGRGYFTDTGTPTLQIKAKIQGIVFADFGAITLPALGGANGFEVDCVLIFRSTGATAEVAAQGKLILNGVTIPIYLTANTASITVDATSLMPIDITATWGTANVSNSITMTNLVMEKIG